MMNDLDRFSPLFFDLILNAKIEIGWASGTGLGAILLAVVVSFWIWKLPASGKHLAEIVRAWRQKFPPD